MFNGSHFHKNSSGLHFVDWLLIQFEFICQILSQKQKKTIDENLDVIETGNELPLLQPTFLWPTKCADVFLALTRTPCTN